MAAQGMHQSQNLSLQQVLAPQLQQSLLILQAPLLELRNLVQQAQLAENQAKIADKLNQLAEAIRVSRIFAARSE